MDIAQVGRIYSKIAGSAGDVYFGSILLRDQLEARANFLLHGPTPLLKSPLTESDELKR
jgi:hypothetical protein